MRRAVNGASILACLLVAGLLGTGCMTPGKEVDSMDPAQCESDEGIVVVRFLTALADHDDLEHPALDPDIDYSVLVGSRKSILLKGFGAKGAFEVKGEKGPALIVRKLEAGDYYFNQIDARGREADVAVRFTVQPRRVTYVGDLRILFIESGSFLGLSRGWRCVLEVGTDTEEVLSLLRGRFSDVPAVDTVPMVVEAVSL